MPKKTCKEGGCLKVAIKDGYCSRHWRAPKMKYVRGDHDEVYNSARWKRLRRRFIKANPLCVKCMEEGHLVEAEIADHINPLRNGGEPFNWENLQPLCRMHHGRKTAQEG